MATNPKPGLIFVSCGQVTDQEKALGRNICGLVRKLTPHEPYFAENQSSLEALSKNILRNLNQAVGLIVILHPRGTVISKAGQPRVRASVWIEQEIAIAAFINQVLDRPLQVAPYVHASVGREGMREHLQLNSIRFGSDSEILDHLANLLPTWRDLQTSHEVPAPPDIGVSIVSGLYPNFTLQFHNRESDEVLVERVQFESEGIELTDPWGPGEGAQWKIPGGYSLPFAKLLTGAMPAHNLMAMNSHMGLPFQTNVEIIVTCLFRGRTYKVAKKLRVRVPGAPIQIQQVG